MCAQLRDRQTSELIAEGTPAQIARAAQSFDAADVLFDDLGAVGADGASLFDSGATVAQHDVQIAAVQAAVDDPDGMDKTAARATLKALRDEARAGEDLHAPARGRMRDARERVRRRRDG